MSISNYDHLAQLVYSQLDAKLAQMLLADNDLKTIQLGLSGGLDSCVLLHLLVTLKPQFDNVSISAIHVNHGVHECSDQWTDFCQDYCNRMAIPLHIARHDLTGVKTNREAVFRQTRYQVFADLLPVSGILLTAHHQNDQAETILFNLFRGAGVRGLRAMRSCVRFASGRHLRPLLSVPRSVLVDYAKNHKLKWIDDSSNTNIEFDRNYIRQKIIPLIEQRWPAAQACIARSGENLLEAQKIIDEIGLQDIQFCDESVYPGVIANAYLAVLNLERLNQLSKPRQHNLLRLWLLNNANLAPSAVQLNQIDEDLCTESSTGLFELKGYQLRVFKQRLYLMQALPKSVEDITVPLRQGNDYLFENLSLCIHIQLSTTISPNIKSNSQAKFKFTFATRKGGENIRHNGQTQQLKTIYQLSSVPTWERDLIPLIYKDNHLIAVPGIVLADDCPLTQSSVSKYTAHIA